MNNLSSNPHLSAAGTANPARTRVAIVAGLLAAAHAWSVWQQAVNNWHHERYSFFPLILIGAVLIAWQRRQELLNVTIPWASGPVPLFSGMVCLVLLAFAVHMNSPWPGALSAIIALRGLLRWGLGVSAAREFAPVWWFLLLGLPLPLGSDRELVLWMQLQVSQAASGMLDLLNYPHDISGVNMMFAEHVFEVEDACSGIQSLYAAVACVALYSALNRRSTPRVLLNIVSAGIWVFVTNVARIVVVCIGMIEWDLPLARGIGHEVVGILAFTAALLLSISTDRVLLFVVPLRNINAQFEVREGLRKSLLRSMRNSLRRVTALAPSTRISAVCGALLLAGFLGLLGWQTRNLITGRGRGSPNSDSVDMTFEREFLPSQIEGWRQANFEVLTRDEDDDLGQMSRVWQFEQDNLSVVLSIDGPYTAWHDISGCYGSQGWKTLEEVDHFARDPSYTEFLQEMGGVEEDMGNELRGNAGPRGLTRQMYVVFSAFTGEGIPIPPPPLVRWGVGRRFPQLTTAMSRLLADAIAGNADRSASHEPIYQLQMIYQADGAITQTERIVARDFYFRVQDLVLDNMQASEAAGRESVGARHIQVSQ